MKIINNWGFGIAALYILFVLSVAGTVIFASFQNVELVDKNYYSNSLVYQKQIDKKKNSNSLTDIIKIMQDKKYLVIIFPDEISQSSLSGNILYFKPNDSRLDFKEILKTDSVNQYRIPLSRFVKGKWLVKIDWMGNGKEFYNEEEVTIR
ncbi:MAG: FixH family protein [Ignavibacteriae bacterium]|nr:FixH family protein [Ignavibacteriota bacterium]